MDNLKIFLCRLILLAFCFTYVGQAASAQTYEATPVSVSKEKVKVDGKTYYSHIVMEKQTLYSISKAYEVSIEDIYKANPNLKETGLKKNGIILIPVLSKAEIAANTKQQETVQEEAPQPKVDEQKEQLKKQEKARKRKVHTVKWFEDLDMIAEKYGVSVTAIMKVNNLEGRKLSARQKLEIPFADEVFEDGMLADQHPAISVENEKQADENEQEQDFDSFLWDRKINLSLILPLKADGLQCSKNNMDFYAGALVAVRDLAEEGMDINMTLFDSALQTQASVYEGIGNSDIVIGPVSSADLERTLRSVPQSCPVVSPLDPKAEALTAEFHNLIQIPTPHRVQYEALAKWMKQQMRKDDQVLFITEKGSRDNATVSLMREALESHGISIQPFSYSILEGRNVLAPLSGMMSMTACNRFVVASESEAFVNDVVRNINLLIHNKYDVVLYAPAKIRNFETIEVENLHNANLHVCNAYNIDYNDKMVMNFLMKYRALFNAEPSQYAFQGYDITRYCLEMSSRHGRSWMDKLEDRKMLQSNFMFRRENSDNGWVNEGVRRIVYGSGWSVKQY